MMTNKWLAWCAMTNFLQILKMINQTTGTKCHEKRESHGITKGGTGADHRRSKSTTKSTTRGGTGADHRRSKSTTKSTTRNTIKRDEKNGRDSNPWIFVGDKKGTKKEPKGSHWLNLMIHLKPHHPSPKQSCLYDQIVVSITCLMPCQWRNRFFIWLFTEAACVTPQEIAYRQHL